MKKGYVKDFFGNDTEMQSWIFENGIEVHEFKETGKNQARMGPERCGKIIFFAHFEQFKNTEKKNGSRICILEPLCLQSDIYYI